MKKLLLAVLPVLMMLAGCEKAKTDTMVPGNAGIGKSWTKLVRSISAQIYWDDNKVSCEMRYWYDDNDRVIKREDTWKLLEDGELYTVKDIYTWVYSGNNLEVKCAEYEDGRQYDLWVLDGNRPVKHIESYDSNSNVEVFTYNASGNVIKSVRTENYTWMGQEHTAVAEYAYIWSGGNLISEVTDLKDGTGVLRDSQYEYYDIVNKSNVEIYFADHQRWYEYAVIDRSVFGGFYGKDLLKVGKYGETYEYEFDSEGYVTRLFCIDNGELDHELTIKYY